MVGKIIDFVGGERSGRLLMGFLGFVGVDVWEFEALVVFVLFLFHDGCDYSNRIIRK